MPEDVRRRLVEEHLLHPRRYRRACGIPSVADRGALVQPGFAMWRCWRGPSWMNTCLAARPAMRELGYEAEAERVVRSLEVRRRYGYREYYNPLTGRGLAARGFGFSTLLVDLLAQSGTLNPTNRPPRVG